MVCSCGLRSKKECKEIFDAVLAKELGDFRYASKHRLTVDAYSLQHPDDYMVSSKSLAAHLTGMCCAMEYGNDHRLPALLQKWLNGTRKLTKPSLPVRFGSLTISHVADAEDGTEHARRVEEWARDVWQAYSIHWDLAKEWIEAAKREHRRRDTSGE